MIDAPSFRFKTGDIVVMSGEPMPRFDALKDLVGIPGKVVSAYKGSHMDEPDYIVMWKKKRASFWVRQRYLGKAA